jgi:hypothetical protein
MVANMTPFESNDSDTCEADSIQIKILEPNLMVLPIPDQRVNTNTCLQIDIGITNNTPTFFPFVYDILTPEFLSPNGQVLHPQKLMNMQMAPSRYNGMGIPHKRTLGCYLIAKFSWQNNLLQLQATILNSSQVPINLDYFWFFESLQLETYKLRFTYLSPQGEFLFFDAHTVEISQIQTSVTSLLATPWVNLQLVEPMGFNNNEVQVDSVRFETVVPEQIWTISHSQLSDVSSSVQIGLSITNNTSISQRFCSFTTLIPALMGADGCILVQNLGGGSHGWVGARESDYHLVEPGKSVTFFVSAHFERQTDGLLNLIVDGTGYGYWSFNGLKLGIYQVRLAYRPLTNSLDIGSFEDFWRGMVHTPFVEFCLVQP